MSYLKKIVGFFVVSVFSIYNCSASSSSSLELKQDPDTTPNSLQVVSRQPPSGIPTDREARKVLFSPPYEPLSLPPTLPSAERAPTYFNPHNCVSVRGTVYEGIDGGVFANHPGVIAYHEAKQLYPNSKILMLSLGTGAHNSCSNTDQSRNRGLIYWERTFSDISIEASSFLNNKLLIELAKNDPNFDYIRLQPFLEQSYMITDGTNAEHIRKLGTIAHKSIGTGGSERERFQQIVNILSQL